MTWGVPGNRQGATTFPETERYVRRVPLVADTVPPLRRAVRRLARRRGASPTVQARVALAFSEACIVLLGQSDAPDAGTALLIVEADADGDALTVRVSDSRHAPVPPLWRERQGFELALLDARLRPRGHRTPPPGVGHGGHHDVRARQRPPVAAAAHHPRRHRVVTAARLARASAQVLCADGRCKQGAWRASALVMG